MNKYIVQAKAFSIKAMIVMNIMLVGAVAGAYFMHGYDAGTSNKTAQAIQAALKSAPTVQTATAATSK